ncbi:MAG TPA: acylase [Leptolyngbyaceae cyanobacterium]
MKRKLFRLLPLLLGFILALIVGNGSFSLPTTSTEILWDTYGVPHIYSKDVLSSFYAFGWAQMQSHGNLILRLYGQARGRAAEYWGEKYLESDRWVRSMGVPERARVWYDSQNPHFREYLDAFAAGINAFASEHPDLINDEVKVVLPIEGVDLLAHVQRVLNFTFVVNKEYVAYLAKSLNNNSEEGKNTSFHSPLPTRTFGSNAWAIAPVRSASGKAMLLANPHLPWSDLFLWYEAQLTAPGIDAYGATLVGIPVLAIAFNDNLGWSHTVNTHDGWDAYQLKLVGRGYQFDGKIRNFEQEEQIIKVKQDNGTFRPEKLVIRRSLHGPVVAETDGKAIALRVVGLDRPRVLEQWWDMARAKNLAEFETVLQSLQLPMFTVMYADRDGHIMHLFNGQVPIHSSGDYQYWSGIVPGDTSTTLWTKIHPYQDLPRIVDPPSGWLQNANDPPWTTTFPVAIDRNNYPAYIAPKERMSFRAQRSARMLAEDERISLSEMIQYKHSTLMELAERLLDDLIPLARKSSSAKVRQAAEILNAWNRKADANSRGAVLFAAWAEEMDFDRAFAKPWNVNSPYSTPDGLADPVGAVAALAAAVAKVETSYQALDVPWGEVFRLRYGKVDLPANGGSEQLGIFRVVEFLPGENGRFSAYNGDSYVAAIEFSNPVKAMVLTSYGNSTQPNSSHNGDQLQLFARQQLRPVWRQRQEIEAHLSDRKSFTALAR